MHTADLARVETLAQALKDKKIPISEMFNTLADFVCLSERGPFEMLWAQITGAA